jgi:uncharacterized protein GlcG (DUF336 family)
MHSIGLDAAKELIAAAHKKAADYNKAVTVAVVDSGGYVILVERPEGARPITPSIAISKAYTGAVMERPGSALTGWSDGSPVFFTAVSGMGMQPIVATEGALTIKKDGQIVGGLGVAGGRADEDEEIAKHALESLGYELDFEAWGQIKTKQD